MNLIKLHISDEEINAYNKRMKEMSQEYPDIISDWTAKSEDDIIFPYGKIIVDEELKKYVEVPDSLENYDGIYMEASCSNPIDKAGYKLRKDEYGYIGTFETEIIKPYGVADNATQVVNYFKDYEKRNNVDLGDCVILLKPVMKESQPVCYGWRWHKWGELHWYQKSKV